MSDDPRRRYLVDSVVDVMGTVALFACWPLLLGFMVAVLCCTGAARTPNVGSQISKVCVWGVLCHWMVAAVCIVLVGAVTTPSSLCLSPLPWTGSWTT